jgi:hypothetical protein
MVYISNQLDFTTITKQWSWFGYHFWMQATTTPIEGYNLILSIKHFNLLLEFLFMKSNETLM